MFPRRKEKADAHHAAVDWAKNFLLNLFAFVSNFSFVFAANFLVSAAG